MYKVRLAEKLPGSSIHISPESMDEKVRNFHKKLRYSNQALIANMDFINQIPALSMVVWFMAGLAKETKRSVDKTICFMRDYYRKLRRPNKNIIAYNELLHIDPGSLAFRFPDKFGYVLLHKSFIAYMQSLEMPTFKYQINYRKKYFTQNDMFHLFLYMHDKTNEIYYANNLIDKKLYDRITLYNNLLRKFDPYYDKALQERNVKLRNEKFRKIGALLWRQLGNK